MKVLIVGSGGREHALAWKVARSPLVKEVYCAPGNPGTATVGTNVPIPVGNIPELLSFAKEHSIDLTIVGPEQPLVDGLADRFREAGLDVFGPGTEGARLEGSKVAAKQFMERHQIPTARYRVYENPEEAKSAVLSGEMTAPLVVKADGLAAGKGVLICETTDQVLDAIEVTMKQRVFGDAGSSIVMESYLQGFEASIHIVTDGERYCMLPAARDHKKIYDGDKGPNTGGMGAVSPAPGVDHALVNVIQKSIVDPFISGLRKEAIPFRGTVFFGLMITRNGPRVLEFNVRFGDPESQVILPRIRNDLIPLLQSAAKGKLVGQVDVDERTAVTVVAASSGYPGSYSKGMAIELPGELDAEQMIFHAGTKETEDGLVTSGGRVLAVTAMGADIEEARELAYHGLDRIAFSGKTWRKDIGLLTT